MKVLVFPFLLAIAIIVGPPQPAVSKTSTTPVVAASGSVVTEAAHVASPRASQQDGSRKNSATKPEEVLTARR
ncbi:hypothetical protein KLP40_07580 [Hymenobacter sp. NST-14]|uniref:hypothetical protein n=1 Tax=Hymenobacter piscis TaxID=2839984 RepID=UPI001C038123|nr:hypothetical protein [Hymenobacter piscis]MBT9393019.1 hypothetical protein [Hymenobacter piscis]